MEADRLGLSDSDSDDSIGSRSGTRNECWRVGVSSECLRGGRGMPNLRASLLVNSGLRILVGVFSGAKGVGMGSMTIDRGRMGISSGLLVFFSVPRSCGAKRRTGVLLGGELPCAGVDDVGANGLRVLRVVDSTSCGANLLLGFCVLLDWATRSRELMVVVSTGCGINLLLGFSASNVGFSSLVLLVVDSIFSGTKRRGDGVALTSTGSGVEPG